MRRREDNSRFEGEGRTPRPHSTRRARTIGRVLLAALLLAAIAYASNVLLSPRGNEAPSTKNREKPSAEQAEQATEKQLGVVFEKQEGDSTDETIGLSDTEALSALTDPQWGSGPFSTAVIARAIAEGYQIDAGKSGVVRSSIQEDQGGNLVYGDIRVVEQGGNKLGTLYFSFDKEASDLLFTNNPPNDMH